MNSELKPCPCCGLSAFIVPSTTYYVQAGPQPWSAELRCHECGLSISRSAATEMDALNKAVEAWNTRAERDMGISEFQKVTGMSYLEAERVLVALQQAGAKVEYPAQAK